MHVVSCSWTTTSTSDVLSLHCRFGCGAFRSSLCLRITTKYTLEVSPDHRYVLCNPKGGLVRAGRGKFNLKLRRVATEIDCGKGLQSVIICDRPLWESKIIPSIASADLKHQILMHLQSMC